MAVIRVGTAAWSIPKAYATRFPETGSHLERYSRVLTAVEINSSFYRHHKPDTYEKWAKATPENFKFSVKLSKIFTHERRLDDTDDLSEVMEGIQRLGDKLRVILVQLPPSLDFRLRDASRFFRELRRVYAGAVALEPRHRTWTASAAVQMMQDHGVSKVIADPEKCPLEDHPASDLEYFRLHGTPIVYRSEYDASAMGEWARRVLEASKKSRECWCIFDNTALGFATSNALAMQSLLAEQVARAA